MPLGFNKKYTAGSCYAAPTATMDTCDTTKLPSYMGSTYFKVSGVWAGQVMYATPLTWRTFKQHCTVITQLRVKHDRPTRLKSTIEKRASNLDGTGTCSMVACNCSITMAKITTMNPIGVQITQTGLLPIFLYKISTNYTNMVTILQVQMQ